jgi:CheY-like chemotaxis protein
MLVLYAEDDAISRSLFEMIVQDEPRIDLVLVEDGSKAWEFLDRGLNPDLCVLDINMPGISGVELVKKMRQDGRFEHTHVVLLTAANDRATVITAIHSNITHYLIKPVSEEQLLTKLRSFLEFLPDPLGIFWLVEPRNYIRRQFMTIGTYRAIFDAFFDDMDRIMTVLTRRMDGSNVNLLLSCVNKISELCVHVGATHLPVVCEQVRTLLSSPDPEEHLNGVRLLDSELKVMLKDRLRVNAYLRELRDRDTIE